VGQWNGAPLLLFDRDTDGSPVRLSDGSTRFVSWVGPEAQRKAVRDAFGEWKALGIGLDFREVTDRSEAEVRIGFDDTDGSWSYVGKDVLDVGANERTMNFGWDLTTAYGRTTALHEIGHTLGMPHEHQNPFAGIVWNEEAVYAYFAGEPNNWPRETTFHNVLRKLDPQEVEGSLWDPDSVMEYHFGPGLIAQPEAHRDGIRPPGTLSPVDVAEVRGWYPPLDDDQLPELVPFRSVALQLAPAEQADFALKPPASRKYRIGSFGDSDVVMVLFEVIDGQPRYVAGDDDSGEDRNALIEAKLFEGRTYVVRLRHYWSTASGGTAVMYW
jgi:astacin (peptidase family M12A)